MSLIKKYKKIIVYDESSENGGIVPILNKIFIQNRLNHKIYTLTSSDKQIFDYFQDRGLMIKKLKLDKKSLIKFI